MFPMMSPLRGLKPMMDIDATKIPPLTGLRKHLPALPADRALDLSIDPRKPQA